MAHGSNNDGTQRESTSLYRSTEGVDPQSGGVKNISLAQRKNNPSSSGSVKHSDFIVDHITGITSSKALANSKLYLKRGETSVITMQFQGAASGFLEENRYAPQNFTWTLSDNSKLAILETSSTTGNYTDGSHRAYKITLKNIWNEWSDAEEDVFITCTFKDEFNNNLDTSHGYNTPFRINVRVRGVGLANVNGFMDNGNSELGAAYDNNLYPSDEEGKNYSPDQYITSTQSFWQRRRAKDGRRLTTVLPRLDAEEVMLRSWINDKPGWTQSPGFNTHDTITSVSYQWQKLVNNNWVAAVDDFHEDTYFNGKNVGGSIGGNFEAWSATLLDKRLNVQGNEGTGAYRLHATITGDTLHPWTYNYISNSQTIVIRETITRVTMKGDAYVCAIGGSGFSEITAQADYMGDESVTYELYKKSSPAKEETLLQTKSKNEGEEVSFNVPVGEGDAYYMVRAKYTDAKPGVRAGGGEYWSDTPIIVSSDLRHAQGRRVQDPTADNWYDKTSIMRRVLQPPAAPNIDIDKREGVGRNIITFTISSTNFTPPAYHVFDDVQWKIDATDVTGAVTTPFPWQTADLGGSNNKTFQKTLPLGVTLDFYARIVMSGNMSTGVVAPGQTNVQCPGPEGTDQSYTINCAQTAFQAPFGAKVPSGYSGDFDVILWEDRGLQLENVSEDRNAMRPEGAHLRVNGRIKDPKAPNVVVTNSSTGMASQVTRRESGMSKESTTITGTETKTINFTDDDNKWELEIESAFGNTTASGIKYPNRYHVRRVNK